MRNRSVRGLCAALCVWVVGFGTPVFAQIVHATGPLPSFEVATIKPDTGGGPRAFAPPAPNTFNNFNVTARDLVRVAYGLPPGPAGKRVLGGPGWIDESRYDVDGKIPDSIFAEMQKMAPQPRRNQMLLMAQSLLADRFKLKVHFETQEMPIYELTVAKGGPKLTAAKELPPGGNAPMPPPQPGVPPRPEFMGPGILVLRKTATVSEMTAKGQTLDAFTTLPFLGLDGSPVVNKTGLTGKYDFVLDWSPDQPVSAAADGAAAASEPGEPPLETALEEQLGLKLVKTKGQVEVVVIDAIERPTAN